MSNYGVIEEGEVIETFDQYQQALNYLGDRWKRIWQDDDLSISLFPIMNGSFCYQREGEEEVSVVAIIPLPEDYDGR